MSSNPAIVIGITATDTASSVLSGVEQKIRQVTSSVEQESNRLLSKTQQIGDRIKKNWQGIATTAASLGAGIVGFATSFDALERAQLGVDRANLTYQKSLERLRDLQASGTASSEDIANAQEQVRINQERATLATDSMRDSYLNFFANVPAQLVSFGTSAVSIYRMLSTEQTKTAGTTAKAAVQYTGALASISASQLATAASTGVLRTALTFLTAHPIVAVMAGAAVVIGLVAGNVGGLRDAFVSTGKAIYEFFLVHFKPLADAMKWFNDTVLIPLGKVFGLDTPKAVEQTSTSFNNLAGASDGAAYSISRLDDNLKDMAKTATDSAIIMATLSDQTVQHIEKLDLEANYLADVARETERATQENYNLVRSYYGLETASKLTMLQLKQTADMIRDMQDAHTDATRHIDKKTKKLYGKSNSFNDVVIRKGYNAIENNEILENDALSLSLLSGEQSMNNIDLSINRTKFDNYELPVLANLAKNISPIDTISKEQQPVYSNNTAIIHLKIGNKEIGRVEIDGLTSEQIEKLKVAKTRVV